MEMQYSLINMNLLGAYGNSDENTVASVDAKTTVDLPYFGFESNPVSRDLNFSIYHNNPVSISDENVTVLSNSTGLEYINDNNNTVEGNLQSESNNILPYLNTTLDSTIQYLQPTCSTVSADCNLTFKNGVPLESSYHIQNHSLSKESTTIISSNELSTVYDNCKYRTPISETIADCMQFVSSSSAPYTSITKAMNENSHNHNAFEMRWSTKKCPSKLVLKSIRKKKTALCTPLVLARCENEDEANAPEELDSKERISKNEAGYDYGITPSSDDDPKEEIVKNTVNNNENDELLRYSTDSPFETNTIVENESSRFYRIPQTRSDTIASSCDDNSCDGSEAICRACDLLIEERVILRVDARYFHVGCLKCSTCGESLSDCTTCFTKFDVIYCKTCYLRKFENKCTSCARRIHATDWVRRARESLYHLACFACEHCRRQLSTGEQFSLQDGRLLCKQHYLELVQGEDSNVKQKAKRIRTTFAEEQLSILQSHFHIDCNPDGSDLERIANLTGLSKRVTQVWFQNSRARQKKHQVVKKSDAGGGGTSTRDTASATTASNSGRSSSSAFTTADVDVPPSPSESATRGANGAYDGGSSSPLDDGGALIFSRSITSRSDEASTGLNGQLDGDHKLPLHINQTYNGL